MKKLLSIFTFAILMFAFAGSASAVSVLYEEDFAHNFWSTSKNWDYIGGSSAIVMSGKTLALMTNSYNKPFTSKASFDLESGNTYTLLVDAFHTLAGGSRELTIQLIDIDNNVLAEQMGYVGYDTYPGYGKSDRITLTFDALQDYSDVSIRFWLGDKHVSYGFTQILLFGEATLPSSVPLPGAMILLAPGLIGLASMRKYVS